MKVNSTTRLLREVIATGLRGTQIRTLPMLSKAAVSGYGWSKRRQPHQSKCDAELSGIITSSPRNLVGLLISIFQRAQRKSCQWTWEQPHCARLCPYTIQNSEGQTLNHRKEETHLSDWRGTFIYCFIFYIPAAQSLQKVKTENKHKADQLLYGMVSQQARLFKMLISMSYLAQIQWRHRYVILGYWSQCSWSCHILRWIHWIVNWQLQSHLLPPLVIYILSEWKRRFIFRMK